MEWNSLNLETIIYLIVYGGLGVVDKRRQEKQRPPNAIFLHFYHLPKPDQSLQPVCRRRGGWKESESNDAVGRRKESTRTPGFILLPPPPHHYRSS